MKKELTVVFPLCRENKTNWILMGKQAEGKKLAGFRNGYGGKCEPGESPIDCAVREVKEEVGLDLEKEKLKYVGYITEGDKKVYFYIYLFETKISIPDNNEFVDNRWFDASKIDEYINKMLPGNRRLMESVNIALGDLEKCKPFELDLSGIKELQVAVKNIYN
jgi:mutator protein MutT